MTVFKSKVLEAHAERRQSEWEVHDSDSESNSSCTEEEPGSSQRTPADNSSSKTVCERDSEDAVSLHRQHEEFMKRQVALAKSYMERKRQLPAVSSRRPVEESEEGARNPKQAAMEGRGPRTVPSSVKNRRKKLKKKRAKERAFVAGTDSSAVLSDKQ